MWPSRFCLFIYVSCEYHALTFYGRKFCCGRRQLPICSETHVWVLELCKMKSILVQVDFIILSRSVAIPEAIYIYLYKYIKRHTKERLFVTWYSSQISNTNTLCSCVLI